MSYPDETDHALLQRIHRGEHDAFQTLYQRHGLALLNYISQMLRDRQQAEDVLQDDVLVIAVDAASATALTDAIAADAGFSITPG